MWLAASARARARYPGGLLTSYQRAAAVCRGCGEWLLSTDASPKTEAASFPIAVAVSGGADSMALMLLLREYLHVNLIKTPLLAITVDHQLRAESADEASEVARVCAERWGITHITRRCEWRVGDEDKQQKGRGNDGSYEACRPVKPGDSKMEEQSRRYRYELLQQVCRENRVRCLFVAHNLGDQLETTLFRLGRASGINGLAGMASQLPFFSRGGAAESANGDFDTETKATVRLVRPLLSFTKAQLMATCDRFQQSWAHDPSNDDPVYDRVRIRQVLEISPLRIFPELG
ncbi:hypothetical protein BBJ28_00015302 [Nothophytophthora sp. Chile5]|nr:hypothetical protein BBJ28_00015302 [Nothophytophthora sp. Chile5]